MKHFLCLGKCLLAVLLMVSAGACAQSSRPGISILGDSYSTFEHYVQPDSNYVWYFEKPQHKTDVVSVEQLWWHRLCSQYGYRLCRNNSFSGSTISSTGYRGEDYSERSFCARHDNLGSPDIILVFGATNDTWAKVPIGDYQYSDWQRSDLYKFRPAMAYLLKHLRERYPGTAVYFILNTQLSADIVSSVHTICKHYDVPLIQLHDIDKQSGHPSDLGMQQIADQVAKVLGH